MTNSANFSLAVRRVVAAAAVLIWAALLLQPWLTMGIVIDQGRLLIGLQYAVAQWLPGEKD